MSVADRPLPFLFDLDGTLADTLADIAASTDHVRAGFGLPPLGAAGVRDLVGHGAGTLLRSALRELGAPDGDPLFDRAYAIYAAHHEAQCTRTARLYPGTREWLDARAAAGHAFAVVTNKPERFARAVLTHLGVDGRFAVVIGGDTMPARKPDPAPLRAALQQLSADAGTMVGDGETDLRAGKAAGLRTIACLYGYRPPALLRAEGADGYWRAFGVAAE
jgi:phosphoglycolate phosphatase